MFFVTKERVLKQLITLAADSIELEREAEVLAKHFKQSEIFGSLNDLAGFRDELSDTTEALMLLGEAISSGRVTPKSILRNLPMFRAEIEIYRRKINGALASDLALGAAK